MTKPSEQTIKQETIRIKDVLYSYYITTKTVPPERPTIVLVHGLVVPGRALLPIAKRLAADFQVYTPDLPGFGKSEKPPQVLTLTQLADALNDWMEGIGLERACLIGSSFGCQIVTQMALHHQDRIQRAVLIGPTTDPEARTLRQQIPRWMKIMSGRLYAFPLLIYDYINTGWKRAMETLNDAMYDPIEQHLPKIHRPTLVIRGSKDALVPQHWAEQVQHLLPDGKLIIIKGASHDVQDDKPDELITAIKPFLQEASTHPESIPRSPQ